MPVQCVLPVKPISMDEFRKLDYQIMRHAFDSHNKIGRLADESVYQADFAERSIRAGFQVHREVKITLSHRSYRKDLFIDHLINQMGVYELKVVKSITDAHRSQLLTYLYLLNQERGKIINFGSNEVQSEFVNAAIPYQDRKVFSIEHSSYRGSETFKQLICELVEDWGTSLSVSLYREAVVSLLGGSESVEVNLPMTRDRIQLANQRFQLVSDEEAFHITALAKPDPGYESHLARLLCLSPLKQLHWVNIEHHRLRFVSLAR
jgi:GxxExxY protein